MEQNNGVQNNAAQTAVTPDKVASNQTTPLAPNRKPLFVYLVIVITVLMIIIFTIYFLHKTEKTQVDNTIVLAKPTVTPGMSYAGWSRINLDTFSIETPLGSDNTLNTFDDGSGYMVIIIPPKSPQYPNEPIFDVEAYNAPQDLAQKQQMYLAEGAKKTTLTVNKMQLPELEGSYKMRMINSNPVYTPTQLRLSYLVMPHAFYVFRMYYSSNGPAQADENLYKQYIASFMLNK